MAASASYLLCDIPSAPSSSASSSSGRRAPATNTIFLNAPTCLHRLGFAAATSDSLFSHCVSTKLRSLKTSAKPARGVIYSIAKKSVGDLNADELNGKKVFMRVDLNVPLDENQNITDGTRVRAAVPTIKPLISNGAKGESDVRSLTPY